jgi:hypothetical protein
MMKSSNSNFHLNEAGRTFVMPTRERRLKQLQKRAEAGDDEAQAALAQETQQSDVTATDADGQEPVSKFRIVQNSDPVETVRDADSEDDADIVEIDADAKGNTYLPGQKPRADKKLIEYAKDVKEKETQRMVMQKAESDSRALLFEYMKKKGYTDVEFEGYHIFIDVSEKAKVQVARDDE